MIFKYEYFNLINLYFISRDLKENDPSKKTRKILINKECKHVTCNYNLKSLIIFILKLFRSVIRANNLVDFFHTLIFVIKCICSYDVQWFVIVTSSEYFRVTFTKNKKTNQQNHTEKHLFYVMYTWLWCYFQANIDKLPTSWVNGHWLFLKILRKIL